MEVRRQIGESSGARFDDVRFDLLRSNRLKYRALRESLVQLSEARGERGRDVRERVLESLNAVREREVEPTQTRAEERVERRVDSIEISDRAQALASGEAQASSSVQEREGARAERLAELRERFEKGNLNTPEAIQRSASRMLGGPDEA